MTKLGLAFVVFFAAAHTAAAAGMPPAPQHHGATTSGPAALRQDLRKLWTDHVIWTRDYIVAAVGDQPDAQAAAGRLMKNQEDIGAAVAGYYGKAAGDKLTALLKEHIAIAVDIIKFAKAGDSASQQQASAKWQRNGEDIADFLSKANPNWPRAVLVLPGPRPWNALDMFVSQCGAPVPFRQMNAIVSVAAFQQRSSISPYSLNRPSFVLVHSRASPTAFTLPSSR